jgi:hypothetical protein
MSTKPKGSAPQQFSADDWVSRGGNAADTPVSKLKETKESAIAAAEQTARFTIDIPVSLHARIKSQCALKRVKMREEVLSMLEEKFPVV